MPLFALYLLKLTISLSIVWIFYQLFLRRLTFYNLNRWYLLGYSVLAFFIPLIRIGSIVENNPPLQPRIIQFIPAIGNFVPPAGKVGTVAAPVTPWYAAWNGWDGLLLLLALGTLVLLIRSVGRWFSLRRVRQQARLIESSGIKIYQVDANITPFSFGNAIYINQHLHTEKEWEEIILHEYVHIRQQHTVDILLAELICILNWYNPFAWLLRYSIRQNLEFIADQQVLENGVDKKNYQYHLLKVIGEPRYRLANNFNFSSLKKRIIMMNKIRSARLHLVKFLFILPLMAVLLVAFRDQYKSIFRRPGEAYINDAGIVSDVITHQPIAGVSVVEKESGLTAVTDANGFYRLQLPVRNDSIHIRLHYNKQGYNSDSSNYYNPSVKETRGMIDLAMMVPAGGHSPYMMMFPYMHKGTPVDPGYEEVLAACKEQFHQLDDWNGFFSMEKAHPEVALFYNAEGNVRHIVIRKDGQVEKYGGPGDQSMKEMEKKYGPLSGVITAKSSQVSPGYLAHWKKIAEEAEKKFHTSNPDVLHIIFPGDSRVLAVTRSGKPEIYDMDNADPKERPSFEVLYGKLPDCVPPPFLSTHTGKLATPPSRTSSSRADTVPKNKGAGPDSAARGPVTLSSANIPANVLYVIDGKPMAAGWKPDTIPPDNRIRPIDLEDPLHTPMFIIDGVPTGSTALRNLNPNRIQSIGILKDASARALYGENAKNGVVLIHTKPVAFNGQPTMTMDTKDGKATLKADTIKVPTLGTTIFNTPH